MSRVLRFVLAGIGSLVGLLVVVVVIALLIPDSIYRDWIVDALDSVTGRELRIDGDFDIQAGTRVKVHATDVHFANAQWGSEPSMASIGRLEAEVALGPLLSGVVAVALDLDAPNLLLETDEAGRGNWDMGAGEQTAEPEPQPVDDSKPSKWTLAPTVRVVNGRFRFVDGASGHTEEFLLANLGIGASDGSLVVDLDGEYLGQAVTLDADLGEVGSIVAGDPTDMALEAGAGEIALAAGGTWSKLLEPGGPTVDVSLALDAPSTRSAEPFAGVAVPDLGKLELTARVAGSGGDFAAESLQVSLNGPALNAAVQGQIADLIAVQGLDLAADVTSEDLPALVDAVGVELPGTVPRSLDAKATLSGGLDGLSLADLAARLWEGEVQAKLTGAAEDVLTQQGVVADFELTAPSLGAFSAYAGRELPESGDVSAKAHLASKEQSYEVSDIEVSIAGEDLSGDLTGSVGDVVALTDVNLNLDALVGSLANFSQVAGTPMPETGPLKVQAVIAASEGVEGPAKISGKLDSDWLRGDIDAEIADVGTAQGVDATLDLELQSLAVFSGIAGRELPAMGPFGVAGKLTSEDETYKLTDLNVAVDDASLKAQLTGSVNDVRAASGIDVALEAQIGSLANFSALAGTALPETKPLSLKANANALQGAQGPAEIVAHVESDWLNAVVETKIADLLSVGGIDGNVSISLASLADLSNIVGRELPAMGPVKATAVLASEGESYGLSEFAVLVEDNAVRAKLSGAVADLLALTGIKLVLDGSVDTLSSLSRLAGTELPKTPKINLNAQVSAEAGLQGDVRVTAEAGSADSKALVQGVINDLTALNEATFEFSADARSLAAVGALGGVELPDVGPLKASSIVRASAAELEAFSIKFQLGKSDIAGDVKVVYPTEQSNLSVTGIFRSRLLDVNEVAEAMPESGANLQEPAESDSGASGKRIFPDDPLPVAALHGLDAYVELNAQRLKLPTMISENVNFVLNLDDGLLKVDTRESAGGRSITSNAVLDANQRPPSLALTGKLDRVPLDDFLEPGSVLEGGALYLDTKVDGRGGSVREIMGGLNGHLTFGVRDVKLQGKAFARFGGDVLSQLNPLNAKNGYSEIECGGTGLLIEDGMATTPRGLVILESSAMWVGNAAINLKTEEIVATVESKARGGLGIGAGMLAGVVQIGGTIAAPTITPNPTGVAKAGLTTILAITTGGSSLLASGMLDRATSDDSYCRELLTYIAKGEAVTKKDVDPATSEGETNQ